MKGMILSHPEKQAEDHYILRIQTDASSALPGQFVSLKIGSTLDPFLRRPFSIFDFSDGIFDIIFQVIGKGTDILSSYNDSEIDILGPLGNGFTLVKNSRVLLIGGGAGNAPLYYLSKTLKTMGNTVTQIYGSRSRNLIYCKERFCESSDNVIFTTDDGSEGTKGFVTDAAFSLLSKDDYDMVYICGPKPMIKGLMPIVDRHSVPCEISLENYFGCGTGICYGCTIRTKDGNRRVCNDGPVFNSTLLDISQL
jgi:dihydroorotate dehydrogenase electron transfer subunit